MPAGALRRSYYANVVQIDEWVGRILEGLERCHGDGALVILAADPGEPEKNRIRDPACPARLAELRGEGLSILMRTSLP